MTKGRILTESNYASPQIDLLVLRPSYPKALLNKKLYLASGVVAAFECKTTLKAGHVKEAVKTAVKIRENLPKRFGSPYRELNSTMIYGLLAHSHSWNKPNSTPKINIEKSLWNADREYVEHPIQCLDFITVANLATWESMKITYVSPKISDYKRLYEPTYGDKGFALTSYTAALEETRQRDYFSPLGTLISGLYSKLAWIFDDMRELALYFKKVDISGTEGGYARNWPPDIYSEEVRSLLAQGKLSSGKDYNEWNIGF